MYSLYCNYNNMTSTAAVVGFSGTWGDVTNVYAPQNVAQQANTVSIQLNGAEYLGGFIETGKTLQLTGFTTPENVAVTWASSNVEIATVDATGKVTCIKEGTTTITATICVEGTNYSDTAIITVTDSAAFFQNAISQVKAYNRTHGGTGSLRATPDGADLRITGTVTGARLVMYLNIPAGQKIIWQAALQTVGPTQRTLSVGGGGTLEVTKDASLESTEPNAFQLISGDEASTIVLSSVNLTASHIVAQAGHLIIQGDCVLRGHVEADHLFMRGDITLHGRLSANNLTIEDSTIYGGIGGIYETETTINIKNSKLYGGIGADYANVTLTDTVVEGTVGSNGVQCKQLNMNGGSIKGGGIYTTSLAIINGGLVGSNVSDDTGIHEIWSNGDVEITNKSVIYNGVLAEGTVTIRDSYVTGSGYSMYDGVQANQMHILDGSTITHGVMTKEYGTVVVSDSTVPYIWAENGRVEINGNSTVCSDGSTVRSVIDTGGFSSSGTVVINGGTVSTETGYGISSKDVTVNGGTVMTAGMDRAAIEADTVHINGGQVLSTWCAFHIDTLNTTYAIDAWNGVTITGGVVYAPNPRLYSDGNNGNTNTTVYNMSGMENIHVSDQGLVIAWDHTKSITTYASGSSNELLLGAGANKKPTAHWAISGGQSGISYKNGSNTGFIPVKGVAVSGSAPVSSIELSPKVSELVPGGAVQLSVSYSPENAGNQRIKTWKSSNEGVATVDSNGFVRAVAVGTATITATSQNGKTAKATVNVKAALTSVTISPATARIATGGSRVLRVLPNSGSSLADATFAWSVESSEPADVLEFVGGKNDAKVTIKGKTAGTAKLKVTVTPPGGIGGPFTATCEVTVYTAVTGLEVDTSTLRMMPDAGYPGEPPTAELKAVITPANAEAAVKWRSTNPSVVAVQPSQDGRSATLAAGHEGSAVVSVSTADGAFTASCVVTVGWAEGTLSLTEGAPPVGKDYLLMATTDSPVVLNIAAASADSTFPIGTPTDLTAANAVVTTALSPAGDTLTITPTGAGTAYVRVSVPGNPGLVSTCKVVVYQPGGSPARRRIDNSTLTVYRRQQLPDLRIPLVLEANGTPWKLTDAEYTFVGANADATALLNAAFKIEPHADGQSLKLVKQAGFNLPASQYKATITVTPSGGEPSATLIPDTLTIKLNGGLPKLTAADVTIESSAANRTADILVTGLECLDYTLGENPAKESANKKTREWVTLDSTANTVTLKAGTPKKSGTYNLTATLNGWDADANGRPATVNFSLKVNSTYTAPQLKLSKTTATVFETVSMTEGIPLQLLPKAADATLAGLSIADLRVVPQTDLTGAEAKTYKIQGNYTTANSYNTATGSFSLFSTDSAADAKYQAGKVLLGAKVGTNEGWLVRVPVTVKLAKPNSTVKLAANVTSVTMNQLLGDPSQQEFTFVLDTSVPGYAMDWNKDVGYTLKRGNVDAEQAGEMEVDQNGNTFTVYLGANVKPGASYKLVVTKKDLYYKGSVGKPGSITLTIKTVKPGAKVSAKLSVAGKTDLTSGACAVLTAKLANYQGGYTTEPTFTVTPPKSVPDNMKDAMRDAFTFEPVGSGGTSWRIVPKPGVQVFPGSYTVSLSGGTLPGVGAVDLPAPKAVKFTVSATKPKVTQSTTKVTMHPADQYDIASVSFTLPAGTPPVKKVEMKGYDASLYHFTYSAGTVSISFKHAGQAGFDATKIKSKTLSFEVYLAGNAKAATAFKVGVTAKAFT
ncbi:Ig-like domain-containing protein [Ruminococcaceae bacterium OttesenSCG-928-D13]|nr:Ig-like domain-containing protein [Ruminococcaceae bacterium OttesenSCG-928-D13]